VRIDVVVANLGNQRAEMKDKIVLTETYYEYLQHLMEHGKLPDDPRIKR
jgi:hypothetical protein